MSLPNGHGSLGSENGSEHGPPLFSRLASTARRRAHAAGNATATALSGAKDGLESFRDNAKKLADRMDQWAADGAVRLAAAVPVPAAAPTLPPTASVWTSTGCKLVPPSSPPACR